MTRSLARHVGTLVAAIVCAAMLAACASRGLRPAALEDARLAVVAARQDPAVAALAPDELAAAESAFRQADEGFVAGGDSDEVRHLGYLAQRRAEIAVQAANRKAAEQAMVTARAEEERVRRLAEEHPAPPR